MATDKERCEVARRLRGLEKGVIGALIPTGELAEGVLRAIDYGRSGAMTPYGCLADLIEPSGHGCVPGECPLNVCHDNDRIDRDALLALADECDEMRGDRLPIGPHEVYRIARRIREACGVK